MPWEAFLQVLKHMFDAGNWLTPCYSVCCAWATKAVMHYRDPSRTVWVESSVEASSDFEYDMLALMRRSHVVKAVAETSDLRVVGARWLSKVMRGAEDVRVMDVVLVEQLGEPPRVCRVDQLVEVVCSDPAHKEACRYSSRIRIWCSEVHEVAFVDGVARRRAHEHGGVSLLRLEHAQITVVKPCTECDGSYITYQ